MGVGDTRGCDPLDRAAAYLDEQHVLVVLDNCEHVLDAVVELVTGLLSRCPNFTLLAPAVSRSASPAR